MIATTTATDAATADKSYDDDNIFAKILRGEIPCDKVFENDSALAFRDLNSQAPTHILILPKGRYISAQDFFSSASAAELTGFAQAVAEVAATTGLVASGYRLIANHGKDAHQEVPHFHLHLLGGAPLGGLLGTKQ